MSVCCVHACVFVNMDVCLGHILFSLHVCTGSPEYKIQISVFSPFSIAVSVLWGDNLSAKLSLMSAHLFSMATEICLVVGV